MPPPFTIRRAVRRTLDVRTAHATTWLADAAVTALVAVDAAGAIAGFALSRPYPMPANGGPDVTSEPGYDAVLNGLYVLAAAQRLGAGRALLRETAALQRAAGRRSMLLWVVAKNAKARAFYEARGAAFVRADDRQPWGQVIYGWQDLATLT